ncbi:hypothetical protein Tco_0851616 [Tanacetum coccineum]|uniref:Uncharacterized protein n=1 Tax=Tanacetum coccineum TaxID=301880 RepID=A0ABQ5B224_9ASTR
MPRNRLVLTKPKSSATIVTRQGILLEGGSPKAITDSRRRDAWNTGNKDKDNGRRSGKQEESKALVTLDGDGVDWGQSLQKMEQENFCFDGITAIQAQTQRLLLDQKIQMRVRDKAGLGYRDQMNKGVLSFENEVFGSLFHSRSSDIEDSLVNNRYAEGMHAVPPPMTGIYIPSGLDLRN